MKRILSIMLSIGITILLPAQKPGQYSVAVFTTQNAMPFGKFTGLFREIVHPGLMLGYGKTIREKPRHDWRLEYNLGYFFHRFVQHSIPVTASLGYRYKINTRLGADAIAGAGYLHSIPATDKWKLNDNGEYKKNKGLGRMQGTASFALGMHYKLSTKPTGSWGLFLQYQQRIQFPFVRSYVPLLPYNSMLIGCTLPMFPDNKKQ